MTATLPHTRILIIKRWVLDFINWLIQTPLLHNREWERKHKRKGDTILAKNKKSACSLTFILSLVKKHWLVLAGRGYFWKEGGKVTSKNRPWRKCVFAPGLNIFLSSLALDCSESDGPCALGLCQQGGSGRHLYHLTLSATKRATHHSRCLHDKTYQCYPVVNQKAAHLPVQELGC